MENRTSRSAEHVALFRALENARRPRIFTDPYAVGFLPGTGDLGAALREAGFAVLDRTVVVWEGVTNYLTAAAVDTTIRQIVELTGSGSTLIFTYVDRAALDGTGGYDGVEKWHDAVRRHGEPWTFGFDPAALPGYLAERGLRLTLDLSARDAAERYLDPVGRHEPAAAFYRIAAAEIQ